MGSKVELFRISIYIFFPVTVFYFFNKPEFYDKYVANIQRGLHLPEEDKVILPKTRSGLEEMRKSFLEKRSNKMEDVSVIS